MKMYLTNDGFMYPGEFYVSINEKYISVASENKCYTMDWESVNINTTIPAITFVNKDHPLGFPLTITSNRNFLGSDDDSNDVDKIKFVNFYYTAPPDLFIGSKNELNLIIEKLKVWCNIESIGHRRDDWVVYER